MEQKNAYGKCADVSIPPVFPALGQDQGNRRCTATVYKHRSLAGKDTRIKKPATLSEQVFSISTLLAYQREGQINATQT